MELEFLVEWSHKSGVTLHDGKLSKDEFEGICRCFLKERNYDVVKREEIKACPVCDTTDTPQKRKDMNGWHYVCCPRCDIRTIGWEKIEYAIESWNSLPRKEE